MADLIYDSFKRDIMDGTIDLDTDTINIALVTSSYTAAATDDKWSDVSANEVTGTGYTAKGITLSGVSVSADGGDNEGVFDANDVTWSSSTITARGAVVFKDTGTASTSPLVCYIDFTSDKSSSANDFTITFDSEGILNLA